MVALILTGLGMLRPVALIPCGAIVMAPRTQPGAGTAAAADLRRRVAAPQTMRALTGGPLPASFAPNPKDPRCPITPMP